MCYLHFWVNAEVTIESEVWRSVPINKYNKLVQSPHRLSIGFKAIKFTVLFKNRCFCDMSISGGKKLFFINLLIKLKRK